MGNLFAMRIDLWDALYPPYISRYDEPKRRQRPHENCCRSFV
jgi:hypothetical protein